MTGWGKDNFGEEGKYPPVLKQVELDMVDHETCENKFWTAEGYLSHVERMHGSENNPTKD